MESNSPILQLNGLGFISTQGLLPSTTLVLTYVHPRDEEMLTWRLPIRGDLHIPGARQRLAQRVPKTIHQQTHFSIFNLRQSRRR